MGPARDFRHLIYATAFIGTTDTERLGVLVTIINNGDKQQQTLVCSQASYPCIILQCVVGRQQELQSTLKVLEGLDILKAFHTLLSTRHMKTLLNKELWRIQSAQSVARAIV